MQEPSVCTLDDKGRPVMDSPHACAMELVLKYLNLDTRATVTREDLADGLQRMGYRLQACRRCMPCMGVLIWPGLLAGAFTSSMKPCII
jgi:hypothetical protein